ncbi:carboxypeptidase regulatory-like domain-containing protein [Bifidobacterium subtile]|uniref:S-layer domain protein n=1 Tax=Bifidobacterium subtile TaxID=77635 RepID=A0A087DTR2_9BIFI|nr:carboxypeptidase regulatory-like domain-containing protein [Bifidobacterium subtile]KFI98912.1 S-layer domain protein [Bifidobacterium subtile]QOL36400.1 carboxypeptidase regulatory-like domain-containing protein [Bifidobacterium subtile]
MFASLSKGAQRLPWFKKTAAIIVTSALAAAAGITAVPLNAYAADVSSVGKSVSYAVAKRVPAVESQIGVRAVPVDAKGVVALPGTDGYDSALLRISAFAPKKDIVFNVAGSAALAVPSGRDASATVLAPISGGKAEISASAAVNARVEVLATFKNDSKTPGATNVVSKPVSRGTTRLGAKQSVGVTGLGGVPTIDVRAAYVTADINLSKSGTVTVADQQLQLPQGHTTVSTIVVPDAEEGDVQLQSSAEGTVAFTVRGWVSGSAVNTDHANVTGSYVPVNDVDWSHGSAKADKDGSVAVPGSSDRALSIALVSATKSDSSAGTSRTFLDVGEDIAGRSQGILVDRKLGAAPQLEVVESSASQAAVSVRGDPVDTEVLTLGDILGQPGNKGSVKLAITSPQDGSSIEIAQTGGITLKGTVSSQSSIDRVEVYGNSTKIGTADVSYTSNGPAWSIPVASPQSQNVTYKAVAIARDGAQTDATINTQVTLPDADDTVINPDAVVVDPNSPDNPVLGVSDNSVTFANQPSFDLNKVIVAGVGDKAPEGFLRRVVAIDHTDAGWVVTTKPATLTEVFTQANIDHTQAALNNDTTLVNNENTDPDVVVEDGDQQPASIVPVDQLDLSDPVDSSTPNPQPQARSGLKAQSQDASSSEGEGPEVGVKSSFKVTLPGEDAPHSGDQDADKATDFSKKSDGDKEAKDKAKLTGGLAISVENSLTLGIRFKLKVDVTWNWFVPSATLKEFRSTIYGKVKESASISVFGKVEKTFVKKDFVSLHTPAITFSIGPIPIVIKTDESLSFALKGSGELSLEDSYEYKKSFEKGVEFFNGSWQAVDENHDSGKKSDPCVPDGYDEKLSGKLTAEAGITADVKSLLYDVVGPQVEAGAKVVATLEVSTGAQDNYNVKFDLDGVGTVAAKIAVTVPVIDMTIEDWTLDEVSVTKHLLRLSRSSDRTCPANSGIGGGTGGGTGGGSSGSIYQLTGSLSDASTGDPLTDADITVTGDDGIGNTAPVDDSGNFTIELPQGQYDVRVTKAGYVDWTKQVDLTKDQHITISLTKPTASTTEYRAVLTWGEYPRDEDSHLIGTDGSESPYHVYYQDKEAYDSQGNLIAWLDVDDTTSYGPETLTFDVASSGTYSYYVHNYSGEAPLNTSGAEVRLYRGDKLVKTYGIPADWSDQNIWRVFSIVNGQVADYVNQDVASSNLRSAPLTQQK